MKKFSLLILALTLFQTTFSQIDVTIYWDASYSMQDRQIEKEFNYLNNYFKKYKNTNVHLVIFSNDIILEEDYSVKDSNWEDLKEELKNTVYDGATSYANLFKHEGNSYILFTDGNENLDKLEPPVTKPVNIISTKTNENAPRLNRIADASKGSYVVISHDIDKPIEAGKKMVFNSEEDGLITGIVTSNGVDALPMVNIINKRTSKAATSISDGSYAIEAEKSDVLVFTYLGKRTVNIKVVNDQMNIQMTDINEQLDEVLVEGKIDKEEMVNIGMRTVDKKRLGYSVETITDEEISDVDNTDLKQVVNGQFAGLQVTNDAGPDHQYDISQFIGRGRNGSIILNHYGLLVVDGVPQQLSESGSGNTRSVGKGESPNIGGVFISTSAGNSINPDNIASITYLKGLAATNKYGTLGKNGVLLITTKAAASGSWNKKAKKIKLGTTATYSENAELMQSLPNTAYLKILKGAKSVDQAFEEYLMQRKKYGNKAEFYLDSYDYFKGWNNPYLSDRILSNIYENFFSDVEVLRALAYKQIENRKFDKALFTYERVLKLSPNQAQSYRDVANAELLAGHYQESLKMYDRVDKMRNIGRANFSGLQKTMDNDFKNLINKHKNDLSTAGVNPKYLKSVKHKTRIIFEWNNPDTEFDLQIVNPQKRFFTWEHTKSKAAQRIAEEKQQGYGLEEFYLTSSDVGEWLFNVKYFGSGENEDIPSYLKVTIYKDFGLPNESSKTEVIRLTKKGKLQTAVKLKI